MEDLATAHLAALPTQAAYHVRYLRYRAGEPGGRVSCPVEAPPAEAAASVRPQARALAADPIDPVREGSWRGE
jgi:hypothetical protein